MSRIFTDLALDKIVYFCTFFFIHFSSEKLCAIERLAREEEDRGMKGINVFKRIYELRVDCTRFGITENTLARTVVV